jgi:hypothetical protein
MATEPMPYEELLHERDELNRRLNEALGRLAALDAGAYSETSPGSGPQHDQMLQLFRQLKLQDFQALSFSLYSIWQKKPTSSGAEPTRALAFCRQLLAETILIEGSKLLCLRLSANAEADRAAVRAAIEQLVRTRFKMRNKPPEEVETKLQEAITKGLDLLAAMAVATPAASLLVPEPHTPFTPELHEVMPGCPDQGNIAVRLMVFPGYLVQRSNRVLEKALVYTEACDVRIV